MALPGNQVGATNVHWHQGNVTRADRGARLGQTGATLWLTGLSGSGKSTLAVAVESKLHEQGKHCYVLDGDNIRLGINKDLSFSASDREENIRRIGEIAKLFVDSGTIVLCSFISPYIADRANVRKIHESAGMAFIEIFVDCSLDEAEARDPKGLYKKARAGDIKNFTGIDDPYEAPLEPELHIKSDQMTVEEEVNNIVAYLNTNGLLCSPKLQN